MLSRELVEAEYAPIYDTYGLGIMCYSPLAGGLLTGTDSRTTLSTPLDQ